MKLIHSSEIVEGKIYLCYYDRKIYIPFVKKIGMDITELSILWLFDSTVYNGEFIYSEEISYNCHWGKIKEYSNRMRDIEFWELSREEEILLLTEIL